MEKYISKALGALPSLAVPAAVFFAVLAGGYIARGIIFSRLSAMSKKTSTNIDDVLIQSLKGPFIIWCAMAGLYLAAAFSSLPPSLVSVIGKTLLVLAIFSAALASSNIAYGMVKEYAHKVEGVLPVTSLTGNLSRIVIYSIAGLMILNLLGISITPILATLGVGGLAVALALQDTLANLFAGFHIILSKQIKVGDYIKLGTGEEGYITDINWRTTKIKMLPNNIVLVPNEQLSKAVVTNYHLPENEMAVLVQVGVHYDSDLEKVEAITCEVGRSVMKEVQGGVAEFEPFIRYHTFNDFSIDFSVILRAKEFVDQYLVKHEFIKRLHKRYNAEGIIIPYPIRAINYSQEKAPAEAKF